MTHVIIYKNSDNGEIVGFKAEGHSGYADAGHDIVCAAVSVLVINTINSIEKFTETDCEVTTNEDDAVIELIIPSKKQSNESLVLLKALELGISFIAESNPDYLSITFEEV